jgi:hypothetical protein
MDDNVVHRKKFAGYVVDFEWTLEHLATIVSNDNTDTLELLYDTKWLCSPKLVPKKDDCTDISSSRTFNAILFRLTALEGSSRIFKWAHERGGRWTKPTYHAVLTRIRSNLTHGEAWSDSIEGLTKIAGYMHTNKKKGDIYCRCAICRCFPKEKRIDKDKILKILPAGEKGRKVSSIEVKFRTVARS